MESKLTNVTCIYTGGGIYVYSALFNDEVWLYGGLDNYFGSYDIPGEKVEESDMNYDAHWKTPSIPYPKWYEILASIRNNCDPSTYAEAERIILHYNPGFMMFDPCIGVDGEDAKHEQPDPDRARLETIGAFIEIFEDFLEEKGIVIPNEEKDEDPDASNIYGTDYGNLSDRIESLLIDLHVL